MRKCKYGSYDEKSPASIFKYALLLKNKNLALLYKEEINRLPKSYFSNKGKGKLGDLVEKLHFQLETNNKSEPDFLSASLELKTTPVKVVNKHYVSKERLSLSMIDYNKIINETFENSSFLKKNSLLLLLFYLFIASENITEHNFILIKLWKIPRKDFSIIKSDWNKIADKVKAGKAEDISGGDTFYLEAFRKGAGGLHDLTTQPNSETKAYRRALGFKSKYLNTIINGNPLNTESIISNDFIENKITLEKYILNKFQPFLGKTLEEISSILNLNYSMTKKDLASKLAKGILGVKADMQIEEFEKADIEIKTITVTPNGTVKESMSFRNIRYDEVLEEDWDTSFVLNQICNKKFFFVIFEVDSQNIRRLKKVMFWNMPNSMISRAKMFWKDIKHKVEERNFHSFWKISDNKVFHVRPKAAKASQTYILNDGSFAPKLAYWINSRTLKEIVSE